MSRTNIKEKRGRIEVHTPEIMQEIFAGDSLHRDIYQVLMSYDGAPFTICVLSTPIGNSSFSLLSFFFCIDRLFCYFAFKTVIRSKPTDFIEGQSAHHQFRENRLHYQLFYNQKNLRRRYQPILCVIVKCRAGWIVILLRIFRYFGICPKYLKISDVCDVLTSDL